MLGKVVLFSIWDILEVKFIWKSYYYYGHEIANYIQKYETYLCDKSTLVVIQNLKNLKYKRDIVGNEWV